jgi:hypothetical protein
MQTTVMGAGGIECFSGASRRDSAISGGLFWPQIGCDEGGRKSTMRELEVQIGNSCQRVSIQLNQSSHRER